MKFDLFRWHEVKPNDKIQAPKGFLRLRLSQASPVYLEAEGYEVLLGVSSSFDVELSQAVTFRAEAPSKTRVFFERGFGSSVEQSGEVFTNIDRMVDESGTVSEITRAMRMFELERRATLKEIRQERASLLKQVQASKPDILPVYPPDDPLPDPEMKH